jgi:Uma2 family endonuclease
MCPRGIPTTITEDEYLALEKKTGVKHEFFEGEVFPLPSAGFNHRIVAGNLSRHLGKLLRGKCNVGGGDLRMKVESTGLLTYADVIVTRGELTMVEPGTTLVNPTLIAEVLSPATELYNRTTKFEHYRQIPTLSMYLLITENYPRIEAFSRETDSVWLNWSAFGPHAAIDIPSLKVTLALAEIYAGVEFVETSESLRPRRR